MFPTTVWTLIHEAGDADRAALEEFAGAYREPVLRFVRRRGVPDADAEDVCHDVFARLFAGDLLGRADAARGRFRSLLLTVAARTVIDWRRKRRLPTHDVVEIADREPDFDREWMLHLAERALGRLRTTNEPAYTVLAAHLAGERQDRQRLWIARRKLVSLIRREIGLTCRSHAEVEEETAYLSRYLRPAGGKNRDSSARSSNTGA